MATNDHASDGSIDAASTGAYMAVGLLADAIGPDTYHGRDVDEAIGHLRTARADAPVGSEAAERIQAALEYLEDARGPPAVLRCPDEPGGGPLDRRARLRRIRRAGARGGGTHERMCL